MFCIPFIMDIIEYFFYLKFLFLGTKTKQTKLF